MGRFAQLVQIEMDSRFSKVTFVYVVTNTWWLLSDVFTKKYGPVFEIQTGFDDFEKYNLRDFEKYARTEL